MGDAPGALNDLPTDYSFSQIGREEQQMRYQALAIALTAQLPRRNPADGAKHLVPPPRVRLACSARHMRERICSSSHVADVLTRPNNRLA